MLVAASQPVEGSSKSPLIDKNLIFLDVTNGKKKSQIYGVSSCALSEVREKIQYLDETGQVR